jgi:hypothetical protein
VHREKLGEQGAGSGGLGGRGRARPSGWCRQTVRARPGQVTVQTVWRAPRTASASEEEGTRRERESSSSEGREGSMGAALAFIKRERRRGEGEKMVGGFNHY